MNKLKTLLKKVIDTIKSYFWGAVLISLFCWFLYEVPGQWLYEKIYDFANSEKIAKATIQYKTGINFWNMEDYDNAIKYLQKSADADNADAERILGVAYLSGLLGVTKDEKKALELLYESKKHKDAPLTEYYLGLIYYYGEDVPKNEKKAFNYFYKSAGAGFWAFFNGWDEIGDPYAQYHLGDMYEKGEGVKRNLKKSKKWFKKCGESAFSIALKVEDKIAVPYLELGSGVGNADSQCILGLWYLYEKADLQPDYDKAFDLLTKSVSQGNRPAAQRGLGEMYLKGKGVSQNFSKAFEYFEESAKQNDQAAQFYLSFMYEEGLGISQNKSEAAVWYQKAAQQGKNKEEIVNDSMTYHFIVIFQKHITKTHKYLKIGLIDEKGVHTS
jgi:TPR repeat protein